MPLTLVSDLRQNVEPLELQKELLQVERRVARVKTTKTLKTLRMNTWEQR